MTSKKPVVLCILDGWGLSDVVDGNAVALADTPCFDGIMANCPSSTLITYGPDVGLPTGQMGNSEVGHMNIGAGRVVEMDLRKIEGAIERGELAGLPGITGFADKVAAGTGVAHLCTGKAAPVWRWSRCCTEIRIEISGTARNGDGAEHVDCHADGAVLFAGS